MMALPVSKRHILVVDDEPLVRETVAMLLEFDGHEVDSASSAAAALSLFELGKFDVIFTDHFMPFMSGSELAAAIKALSPCQPVVMLSAWAEKLQSPSAEPVCVDFFICKPFGIETLREAVSRVMLPKSRLN
jgi:CheY-like chemotaxis protein